MTSLERLLIAVVVLALALFGSYRFGRHVGMDEEKHQWEQRESNFKTAEIELRKDHAEEMARLVQLQQQTNLKNSEDHEIALENVRSHLAAAVAESRRLGGLRIPAPASSCRDAGTIAQTTGVSQRDEETPTTIALPEAVETRLWTIVGEADEVLEQARACQAWIVDNGFYGAKP